MIRLLRGQVKKYLVLHNLIPQHGVVQLVHDVHYLILYTGILLPTTFVQFKITEYREFLKLSTVSGGS